MPVFISEDELIPVLPLQFVPALRQEP